MLDVRYGFVPRGTVAEPAPGRVYLDVGNRLVPGVIDHHQPGAPAECTTGLVLAHPDYVTRQIQHDREGSRLELITHLFPDLDAVSAVSFAARLARGEPLGVTARRWADYVRSVDQGHTRLSPQQAVTPYSVFLVRLDQVAESAAIDGTPEAASRAMLEAGNDLLQWILNHLEEVPEAAALGSLMRTSGRFEPEIALIEADIDRYRADRARAKRFHIDLPRVGGGPPVTVPGIWIDRPESRLFRSWARGDAEGAGDVRGFVFTAVRTDATRFILAVAPQSGVWLKGLGDRLEAAEDAERRHLGRMRQGEPRPGYSSPDPWYDGRSALHAFTIVDAPREGTVLGAEAVWRVLKDYVGNRLYPLG